MKGSWECPRCSEPLEHLPSGVARCHAHGALLATTALRHEIVVPRAPPGEPTFGCPVCPTMMREVRVDEVRLDHCAGCDHWWIDADDIDHIRDAMLKKDQRRLLWGSALLGALGG